MGQVKFNSHKLVTLLNLYPYTHDTNALKVLSELDQVLYSHANQSYSAKEIKQALQNFMASATGEKHNKNHILPDLWTSPVQKQCLILKLSNFSINNAVKACSPEQ